MPKKTITAQEVLAAVPGSQSIDIPDDWFTARYSTSPQSVWTQLYKWLATARGHVDNLDLHERTVAGKELMTKLLQVERRRLAKKHGIRGNELDRALSISNTNAGPHGEIGGRTLVGTQLVVLPSETNGAANVRI